MEINSDTAFQKANRVASIELSLLHNVVRDVAKEIMSGENKTSSPKKETNAQEKEKEPAT